ncbi:hypothetical protein [Ensifer sp. NM-2]|uniref:hypothetical protein n=1 Tax=Ensifer sp. NM-2 TaxID=2109730 RepID=UPI0011B20AB3|nr:hypothetical protein [Ensifer sp. NM-2]
MIVKLGNEFTQSAGLRDDAIIRICIDPLHRSGPEISDGAIIIGLEDADSPYLFDRVNLVVEDTASDGELYLQMVMAHLPEYGGGNVSFDLRHGGGQASDSIFQRQIEQRCIVCVVGDSDKLHPQKGEPAKLLRTKRIIEESAWPFAWAFALPCREIENLIPTHILGKLACAGAKAADLDALTTIHRAEDAAGLAADEFFGMYYDLKEGIDERRLNGVWPEHISDWVRAKLLIAGDDVRLTGFGSNIIRQLLGTPAVLREFLAHTKKEAWQRLYGHIIRFVLWLGFAPMRQIV